ncbi:MAG TPA: DUF6247 family protein [Pseudonocardiaceae bacterium]
MAATYALDEQPGSGNPLQPGASPRHIRAALLPEDRTKFDAAYARALADARVSLDLTELFKTLERWRRRALIQRDPQEFRRVVRRAAELLTGEAVPADEPLAVTRAKVGM